MFNEIFCIGLMNKSNSSLTNTKKIKVEDMLNYLSEGFLRGNINLLKSSIIEQSKGLTTVSNEIRIGITHVSYKSKKKSP